jgi:hypothetical protein
VRCMNRCSTEPEEEVPLEELFKRLHDAECRKRGV